MIVIVDYGIGNIRSLIKAFEKIKVDATASSDHRVIAKADRLVLPGVGHFGAAMDELRRRRLPDLLTEKVMGEGVPVLGVCLGMQLMTRRSEEGAAEGLGWIDAETRRFRFDPADHRLKSYNMGWLELDVRRNGSLFCDIGRKWRFYFVHGYHVVLNDPADLAAQADYGGPFTAALTRGRVSGVQFHPEKSHQFGFRLLRNFASSSSAASAASDVDGAAPTRGEGEGAWAASA
jgi:imidazole glycerol-phosphate synthase subunit HisH